MNMKRAKQGAGKRDGAIPQSTHGKRLPPSKSKAPAGPRKKGY